VLLFAAWMVPAILLGTWFGVKVVPRLSQSYFQASILVLTALGAIRLLI